MAVHFSAAVHGGLVKSGGVAFGNTLFSRQAYGVVWQRTFWRPERVEEMGWAAALN